MAGEKVISGNLRLTLGGKTIFHATNCNLQMSRDFKERATKDTIGTERAKGSKSWTASFDGLATYAGGTTSHDFASLFDLYDDDTDQAIDVEFVPAESDADYIYRGQGFIDSLQGTFPNDEDATISLSVIGNGVITKKEL